MECLHTLQERLEETLSAAFEVYGRSAYFDEDEELGAASNVISGLLDASISLDDYLEDIPEDEEPDWGAQEPFATVDEK